MKLHIQTVIENLTNDQIKILNVNTNKVLTSIKDDLIAIFNELPISNVDNILDSILMTENEDALAELSKSVSKVDLIIISDFSEDGKVSIIEILNCAKIYAATRKK